MSEVIVFEASDAHVLRRAWRWMLVAGLGSLLPCIPGDDASAVEHAVSLGALLVAASTLLAAWSLRRLISDDGRDLVHLRRAMVHLRTALVLKAVAMAVVVIGSVFAIATMGTLVLLQLAS